MENTYWSEDGLIFYSDNYGEEYEISSNSDGSYNLVKRWVFMNDSETIWELEFNYPLEDIKEFIEEDYRTDVIKRERVDKELMEECHRAMDEFYEQEISLKNEYKKKLKGLINIKSLWEDLEELDSWRPEGIVEVIETDKKRPNYPDHSCAEIKDEPFLLYMKTECEVKGINYHYVLQQTGYLGDDYSGFLLYPLKDGTYFKVSYNC